MTTGDDEDGDYNSDFNFCCDWDSVNGVKMMENIASVIGVLQQ